MLSLALAIRVVRHRWSQRLKPQCSEIGDLAFTFAIFERQEIRLPESGTAVDHL
jgi:hypothetical protein